MATSPQVQAGPAQLSVDILPMRRRHLRSVLRIEHEVYPRPWSLGLFMSELGLRSERAYLVARVGGAVVGYGGAMLNGGEGHITTLAVDPAWQGRTIGTRLLVALVRETVVRGCAGLTLEVRMGNVPAQELYRRFGFAPAGTRKNYYVETNEDALIMWAHDVDLPAHAERLDRIAAGLPATIRVEQP